MILRLPDLIDEKKAYQILRELRWKYGFVCPFCSSNKIRKRGKNHRHQGCQRYECQKLVGWVEERNPAKSVIEN